MIRYSIALLWLATAISVPRFASAQDPAKLAEGLWVVDRGTALEIRHGRRDIAEYVYAHDKIQRPFFANLYTVGNEKITRNFPLIPEFDDTDHPTMHPGIWLAFGDISGVDFWRNKGRIEHQRFIEPPVVSDGVVTFVQQKRYLAPDQTEICVERFACRISTQGDGVLLQMDSTFSSDREFYFGDQEEMGLGIRVHTPITEKQSGRITDSDGRRGAKQVWSQSSRWCDYSRVVGDRELGITIFCHPGNFRASWMHARDYGLIAANPFGRAAMKKGPADKTVVRVGRRFRLRYGVFAHQGDYNTEATYQMYVSQSTQP